MAIDKQLLKSYITRHDATQETLARAMGVSLSGLNAKINEVDGREFKQSEICFIKDRYGLTPQDVANVFFAS